MDENNKFNAGNYLMLWSAITAIMVIIKYTVYPGLSIFSFTIPAINIVASIVLMATDEISRSMDEIERKQSSMK